MKRIDHDTVSRILDAADIVEVVSDFVKLRRSGANYKGLCPFHDDRTPSFSVNRTRNICKCFSCGKGGSPVTFIMEHEQMSYQDALRYLAKKYNIEINEHELSDSERQAESERESMLAINEFALSEFEHNLTETADGQELALTYFRHRGINDAMIKRFHLGYSIDKSDALYSRAVAKGFSEKFLIETGLCIKSDREGGGVYDRFRGRIMYPIHSVSGRVIGFGGRTMRKEKTVAKYVNSPESIIYKKNKELYGLFQAKSAIAKKDKCILVEGYMDVISMHQSGIENVVASSGTSLTEGQIRAIRRFTSNITLIYDADTAGIKASLRGIDMLLAESLNVKVLLLPEGEDPDSFAQSHSATEVEAYLKEHEQDVIAFMTDVLMRDIDPNDPTAKAHVVNTVLRSVAMVTDPVTRSVYIEQCSRRLGLSDSVITLQLNKLITAHIEDMANTANRNKAANSISDIATDEDPAKVIESTTTVTGSDQRSNHDKDTAANDISFIRIGTNPLQKYEMMIMRYIVRYGLLYFCDMPANDKDINKVTVYDYIASELKIDEITFSDAAYQRTFVAFAELKSGWIKDRIIYENECNKEKIAELESGREQIRLTSTSVAEIEAKELDLVQACDDKYYARMDAFDIDYAQRKLTSYPDDTVRLTATDLTYERHTLSKIHTKFTHVETEQEQLHTLVPRAIHELKAAILAQYIKKAQQELAATNPDDTEKYTELLTTLCQYQQMQKKFAKTMGERIILPRKF